MGTSGVGSVGVGLETCYKGSRSDCYLYFIFSLASLSFGCLPIIFIVAGAWSAFKKRKHWIPAGSLVVGALALQLLSLLSNAFDFSGDIDFSDTDYHEMRAVQASPKSIKACKDILLFEENWVSVVGGRVSVCVLMGCLLPGVARPFSTNLWSDTTALIISSSVFLFHVSYETYMLATAYQNVRYLSFCYISRFEFVLLESWNVAILVSMVFLVLLLASAALASVDISLNISQKIPTMFSAQKFNTQFSWEKVEEQATKSLFVARTADPQYIMARSILSSSIAFVITICNGIFICEILRFSFEDNILYYVGDLWLLLRFGVIIVGSIVIYWRCITAVVYYPANLEWKWSSLSQYFEIEDFWKSHLVDLIETFTTLEAIDGSAFKKLMIRLCRLMKLHKLLHVLLWLQMFSILVSKVCWLLSQLLFSNKYLGKLFIGSAYEIYRNKTHREILLGKTSDYGKYFKALVIMHGENPVGIWVANRKSIVEVKKHMQKGETDGKKCNELAFFLRNNSSRDFRGENFVKPQSGLLGTLEVERELDVRKCSWKMTAVSIITVIIELSSFNYDETEANDMVDSIIKACSQGWNIMDVVENCDSEAVNLSKAANKLFHNLHKSHKWLDYSLPMCRSNDRSPAAAKVAIRNLVQKGKQIANEYYSRKWCKAIAGYSLYRLGVHMNYEFNSVQEIFDEMCKILADVMGSCTVKAVGVIMESCKKHATMSDEESILKFSSVAGKVKGVTENVGWNLKWCASAETQSIKTSLVSDDIPALRKYPTFQMV